jgi:hypothetical protein
MRERRTTTPALQVSLSNGITGPAVPAVILSPRGPHNGGEKWLNQNSLKC